MTSGFSSLFKTKANDCICFSFFEYVFEFSVWLFLTTICLFDLIIDVLQD